MNTSKPGKRISSVDQNNSDDDLITVCDKCLQASCWQGIFMCYESRSAGIVQKTRRELAELGLEHPLYWKPDEELWNDE